MLGNKSGSEYTEFQDAPFSRRPVVSVPSIMAPSGGPEITFPSATDLLGKDTNKALPISHWKTQLCPLKAQTGTAYKRDLEWAKGCADRNVAANGSEAMPFPNIRKYVLSLFCLLLSLGRLK